MLENRRKAEICNFATEKDPYDLKGTYQSSFLNIARVLTEAVRKMNKNFR